MVVRWCRADPRAQMPPHRPGSPPLQLVFRLTDLQHSLEWMRSQYVAGSFSEPQWLEQVDTLLPHNLLYPQSIWGHYTIGLPTCERPNHWHILQYLEHWRDEQLISRAKERLLTDYVMHWSGSGRRNFEPVPLALPLQSASSSFAFTQGEATAEGRLLMHAQEEGLVAYVAQAPI